MDVFGTPVVVLTSLPIVPSDGTNARRMVRHGLADVLEWLGLDVGPEPYEEQHAFISSGWGAHEPSVIYVSAYMFNRLKGYSQGGLLHAE
jgi:hypothetical protein